MNYKEQVLHLHERVLQKKSIEAKVRELKSQLSVLEKNVRDYKEIMWKEQIDVERLEKISLTNIFYIIFGKFSKNHRTRKSHFLFQSQRKAMPKNAKITAQLHSSHTLAK